MQEDVLGTRRTILRTQMVVECARCHKMVQRSEAKIMNPAAVSEGTDEIEYLCRDCQRAIAVGEADIPAEED